jgi:hypothetical protein
MAGTTDRDVDLLFTLPLSEFTSARNALVKRLKQARRGDDAEKVKAIPKPSISAWAVNQLYWSHRREFDRLLEAGHKLAQAQISHLTGAGTDVRGRINDRREAIAILLQLADALLRAAGHSSTPETLRRIEATLEALSTSNATPGAAMPGRLAEDVAPQGFESLAALMPPDTPPARRDKPIPDTTALASKKLEDAAAAVKATESQFRQAEENLTKARTAADEALRRAQALSVEVERAEAALRDLESTLSDARAELHRLENA